MSEESSEGKTTGEVVESYCRSCGIVTRQAVAHSIDFDWNVEAELGWEIYQILVCANCDTPSFRHSYADVFGTSDENGELIPDVVGYPVDAPPKSTSTPFTELHQFQLPDLVVQVYDEVIIAVRSGAPILAGVGIRTLVETICRELKTRKASLEARINDLVSKGYLTPAGAEILHGIRLVGNDAAHETKPPTDQQIRAALQAIDHLLLGVYILPMEAKVLPKPVTKDAKTKAIQRTKSPKASKKAPNKKKSSKPGAH